QIYGEFRIPLPMVTEAVLALGANPLIVIIPVAVVIIAVLLLRWLLGRTEGGRRFRAGIVYSIPVVGTLFRSARLAAFVEPLAIMVDHAVPLPEAIGLAGQATADPFLAGQARDVRTRLENGQPLGQALRGQGLLPEWVAWMTLAGERRGALGE